MATRLNVIGGNIPQFWVTKVILSVVAGGIIIGMILLYQGIFIARDYESIIGVDCNPAQESCFMEACEESGGECYYKLLTVPASVVYACQEDAAGCDALNCATMADGTACDETFCDPTTDRCMTPQGVMGTAPAVKGE